MKTTIISIVVTFLLLHICNQQICCQNEKSLVPLKKFGIGIHANPFRISDDFYNETMPSQNIIFTFQSGKKWRIEPEAGLSVMNDKLDNDKHVHVNFGLGVFRLYRLDNTFLLGGIRIGYGRERSKYFMQTTSSEWKSNRYSYSVGPFVGAEYFFGNHFSIGAEVGLRFMDMRKDEVLTDDYNHHETYLMNESGVLLRFYF